MNDLGGLEAVRDLAEAGVASLKIEGRMRSQHFVGSIVAAYRLLLDNLDDDQALVEAKKMCDHAMGRDRTNGYFHAPQPADAIVPYHSGNIGLFIGKLGQPVYQKRDGDQEGQQKSLFLPVKTRVALKVGDRLRLQNEKSGERHSLRVKKIFSRGESVFEVQAGWSIQLDVGKVSFIQGDSLYKTDVKTEYRSSSKEINPGKFLAAIITFMELGKGREVYGKLALNSYTDRMPRPKVKKHKVGPTRYNIPVWLRGDDWQLVRISREMRPEKMVMLLDEKTIKQAYRNSKSLRSLLKVMVWALPPIILEDSLEFYAECINWLRDHGFWQFQLGHISQVEFFKGRPRSQVKKGRLLLYGSYTMNIMNSLAMRYYNGLRIAETTLAIEADFLNHYNMSRNRGLVKVGLDVYGHPSLFTSRLKPEFFPFAKTIFSPKGERFELREQFGQTVARADEAFSLLDNGQELSMLKVDFVVIDLCGARLTRQLVEKLMTRLVMSEGKKQKKIETTFNFHGKLI